MRLQSFFIILCLFPSLVFAQSSWRAEIQVDLTKINTSQELAKIIDQITDEWGLSGETEAGERYNCYYRSFISATNIQKNSLQGEISFDFKKDSTSCGNGESGIKMMWTDISSIPYLTIGELQQN